MAKRAYIELQLRKARHDFLVENWPPHLQRASKIERKLLELMRHPFYRLWVDREGSIREFHITTTDCALGSPVTPEAQRFLQDNREALIAWVEHTTEINERIARLEAELK